jgi:acyl-CoA synthetase (NDP forming)
MKLDFARLDRAFKPETVAVIGDKPGGMWFRATRDFKGKMYSVHTNPETAKIIEDAGYENFKRLTDIPGPVDLVIVSVPRAVALKIMDDCIEKDVGGVHFFTAGFSETHKDDARELEREIEEKARAANLHLIGPNCMGVYNPSLALGMNLWEYSGRTEPVGIISQSGTHATSISQHAHLQGIDIDRAVSFGNGIVLDSPDYLEYYDQDPGIRVIGMYLEGVKDGRRFLKVLKDVSSRKPVVIWKGGRTAEGDRAIASHTGSLAVSREIWSAALRQCGAVEVSSREELLDAIKALLYLKPVRGLRVGITGGSGGQSVAIADVFGEAGLVLPRLSEESYKKLDEFFTLIGGGYPNPIDTGNVNRTQLKRIMEILRDDPNIDNLVLQSAGRWARGKEKQEEFDLMINLRNSTEKPVLAIAPYSTPEDMRRTIEDTLKFQENGIPAFPTMESGARALRHAYDYYKHREG